MYTSPVLSTRDRSPPDPVPMEGGLPGGTQTIKCAMTSGVGGERDQPGMEWECWPKERVEVIPISHPLRHSTAPLNLETTDSLHSLFLGNVWVP